MCRRSKDTGVQKTWAQALAAALLITAKTGKPKCPHSTCPAHRGPLLGSRCARRAQRDRHAEETPWQRPWCAGQCPQEEAHGGRPRRVPLGPKSLRGARRLHVCPAAAAQGRDTCLLSTSDTGCGRLLPGPRKLTATLGPPQGALLPCVFSQFACPRHPWRVWKPAGGPQHSPVTPPGTAGHVSTHVAFSLSHSSPARLRVPESGTVSAHSCCSAST